METLIKWNDLSFLYEIKHTDKFVFYKNIQMFNDELLHMAEQLVLN